uniref:hypothetical protein n=1 Tax=Streptomyces sp. FM008 TaxID=1983802 RepID=UPI001CA48C61
MSGQGGPRADGAVVRCVGGAELLRVRVLTVPVVRNGSGAGLLRMLLRTGGRGHGGPVRAPGA